MGKIPRSEKFTSWCTTPKVCQCCAEFDKSWDEWKGMGGGGEWKSRTKTMKWLYESQINGSIVLNLQLGMVSELQRLTIRNLKIKCLQFFFFWEMWRMCRPELCDCSAGQKIITFLLCRAAWELPSRPFRKHKFCYQRWIGPKTRVLLNQWLLSGPHD